MGDGGVAFVSLQQQQFIIMENLSTSTTNATTNAVQPVNSTYGTSNAGSNGFGSTSSKLGEPAKKKKIVKVKKVRVVRRKKSEKSELESGKVVKTRGNEKAENGEIVEKVATVKDEVEEGELGTMKWGSEELENGEFLPEKAAVPRSNVEKGEIVGEKLEKGEIVPEKRRKGEAEERGERDLTEKGEFVPDRCWKGEASKDEYGYSKERRYDSVDEKGWKIDRDRDHDWTPPSGKYDAFRGNELNRGGNQHGKSSSRWEIGQERNARVSSKVLDDENSYKSEHSNGKEYGREHSSFNRLKRYTTDIDNSERKHHGDYAEYAASKSRRLSHDSNRSVHLEHHSRYSAEKSYRHTPSSRISSSDKYSSRHYDSSLSSRVGYDRRGHSPGQSEWSPHDRARSHDHRDRSPVYRDRSPYTRDKSPYIRERSTYDRSRYHDHRNRSPTFSERSPYSRGRSPYDRSRHRDFKNRSPSHSERSPQDRPRHHRDQTPKYLERSPPCLSRANGTRETIRKPGAAEKSDSHYGDRVKEEKPDQRNLSERGSSELSKESVDGNSSNDIHGLAMKNSDCNPNREKQSQSPVADSKEFTHVDGPLPEELTSMEEDMDICDTPPHDPLMMDTCTGKWYYLDYHGAECGPSKLCELKALVEEGILMSDHLIKHLDSDRWVTVENASSPLVVANFPSIASDAVTQLVSPPEAPGNLLVDNGGLSATQDKLYPYDIAADTETLDDLHIDERVGALLEGYSVVPGKELQILGEALQMVFEQDQWERFIRSQGFSWNLDQSLESHDVRTDAVLGYSDVTSIEAADSRLHVPSESNDLACDWHSSRWSCKGGDWKRNDDTVVNKSFRKKLVLNDGFPLCQMPKSGCEDPRWHHKDELYHPHNNRKLNLAPWAFSSTDEKNDSSTLSRTTQTKPTVARGVKGTMMPVVRINACVVDHGSFVSEPRIKSRGRDRYSSRSVRSSVGSSDAKRSSVEGDSRSWAASEPISRGTSKSITSIDTPKNRLCAVNELHLPYGDWYYLDGAGHEQGPFSFSELQKLVDQGVIQNHASVFRKSDKVWVPVTYVLEASAGATNRESDSSSGSFHSLYPQFISYTRWKLHELVMKSYKSREFAAAINDVLDPWINAKQPKKEMQSHGYQTADGDAHTCKRARVLIDEDEDGDEMEDDMLSVPKDESNFEDLRGDATFYNKESASSEAQIGSWGLLDGHLLARVFHCLRSDLKSLAFASLTCKHWRAAVCFYKDISKQVDLSSIGPKCSDSIFRSIMTSYRKEKINSLVLVGCSGITSSVLEDIIGLFPSLSWINIRGCSQFGELVVKFQNIKWINSRGPVRARGVLVKSLKQITDKTSYISTTKIAVDDFGELKEYFDSVDKRDSTSHFFRRSLYKRSKLFDARRSSSILSRDARMRRWTIKKPDNGYKRMEEFLSSSLKEIMRENTSEFFIPKVAEIEEKMKNGFYISHGLNSVKEDISRMCRDAIKAKNRGDAKDMNNIITLFIQLATRLEENSKTSYQRDETMRSWKDDSPTGFSSAASRYKKRLNKAVTDRKYTIRSNGDCASDREIRRRLSKLNRKSMDSCSATSEDSDGSSAYNKSYSESTDSETESDPDLVLGGHTGESRGDGYLQEEYSDYAEREWGARMTKASLVPPVTRKYEVIDEYVIVADKEDVNRKMRVSLPEDYAEKLEAQRNGTEESDMELPEVKDFKPRKLLGDEVIEQEVYGIDPYTHNLLLDSMPEESDWSLLDRQMFIEDLLLRTLNKQVRHYTGSGNTPMMYHLRPVIEEIERNAEENNDMRTVRICRGILKAMDSRPDDKYVAYRKGLGVVCNKIGGFGGDDFVVEFLGEVYPAWKWFEKQDGIRSLQKDSNDPAPEFYNIYLERPKGDADGYDLVVVDAMHKANYASRICHSCRPNCEAKVTAVNGHYQIGVYSVRGIQYGEEITFDYNSVTESKEEYEASVCLCGSQVCRGSYLNLTGEGAFQKVLSEWHGLLDRIQLIVKACEVSSVSEEDYIDLGRAGLGRCLLGGLPDWLIAYSAHLVRFINFERTKLPEEILRHNLEEKRKYFSEICLDVEKSDAEVQAEGVYNQRLQNLALTLDKVRNVMRCVFDDPKNAPPPLEKLSPEAAVSFLWKGEGSLVEELLQSMATHMEEDMLNDLKSKIQVHDPLHSDNIAKGLRKSLLWLRDEIRNLPCTYKCRHDAAADLIHIYAHTKFFYKIREYKPVTSPPVYISPLDLGPKYADKLGGGLHEYCKKYGENYCLGQLIFWHNQSNIEPDNSLFKASRGCLSLPDIGSFYAKKPQRHCVYGPRTVKLMISRMEKQPQRPWPRDRIWSFKSSPKFFGTPMLDAGLSNSPLDRDMVNWLKNRLSVYEAMWDR